MDFSWLSIVIKKKTEKEKTKGEVKTNENAGLFNYLFSWGI